MSEDHTRRPAWLRILPKERPIFLMVSLFALLLVHPFLEGNSFTGMVVAVFFTLILLSSAVAVMQRPRLVVAVVSVGLPAVGFSWCAELLGLTGWPAAVSGGLQVLFMLMVVGLLVLNLMRTHSVTGDTICQAVSAYLLIGFAWGTVYGVLEGLAPGAFTVPLGADNWGNAVYFSFTTLTTLGFGDVTPVTPVAQAFVITEAIVGPLYLAILLARLMGLYLTQARQGT